MTESRALSSLPFFEKAKSLFPLSATAEPATERAWELYTANRLGASKFRGIRETGNKAEAKKQNGGDGDEEDEDEDENENENEDDSDYCGDDMSLYALRSIRSAIAGLDEEMGFDDYLLSKSFRLLSCDALFEEADQPRTVDTLTRLYSPVKPVYVDVHLNYHCRSRMYEIEWFYTIGYKIYKRPAAKGDYYPSGLSRGSFGSAHTSGGWRPIAHGFFEDTGEYGRRWKRIESSAYQLDHDGILDIREALFGPLEELPDDADEDTKIEHRRNLVDTVRLLLAAVGINYSIACVDEEEDDVANDYMLEGLSDRWFARETRKACGFQLTKDPEQERKAKEEKNEELRGDDDNEEYDSDGNRMYDSEDDDYVSW